MAEFRVVIEGLDLDTETTNTINDSIQKVVLDHLANIDLTSGRNRRGLIAWRPHPEWRGLVAQVVSQKDLGQLAAFKKLNERIGP